MRGSSPLQAALRRLVADELTQNTDNQEACTVLFDVESFYDSISLSLVARAGLKLAYPPILLSLALLAYAGVRFLTAGCRWIQRRYCHQQWGGGRDARKAITLQDWRSTTFCRNRMSCTRPPRLRNGWTIWHSARRLRRVRWSTKRWRRRCSWYRTYKRVSWRLPPNLWSLRPRLKSPDRLYPL